MCAFLLDTKGPEIRTGKLKDGKDINLVAGQDLDLVNDFDLIGDETKVCLASHDFSTKRIIM